MDSRRWSADGRITTECACFLVGARGARPGEYSELEEQPKNAYYNPSLTGDSSLCQPKLYITISDHRYRYITCMQTLHAPHLGHHAAAAAEGVAARRLIDRRQRSMTTWKTARLIVVSPPQPGQSQ